MWEAAVAAKVFDPAALTVTAEQRDAIASMKQGTAEWLQARYGRLTASNFGSAAGHGPGAKTQLLQRMVWPETAGLTGRAAEFAAYGTTNEPVARDVYVADRMSRGDALVKVFETGLLVSVEHGWLGSSPDFVVEERTARHERPIGKLENKHHCRASYIITHPQGADKFVAGRNAVVEAVAAAAAAAVADAGTEAVITDGVEYELTQGCGEIKCPATRTLYSVTGKHTEHDFPAYYYDQIQGVMAVNGWPWCDTVVYTPHETQVIRFHRNEEYWEKELFPLLRAFYFDEFLPRMNMRLQGRLRKGHVDPIMTIPDAVWSLGLSLDDDDDDDDKNGNGSKIVRTRAQKRRRQ
jgi:hypothetical protein